LQLLKRWQKEAETTGRSIERITVAYEAGRDGCWLLARGVEAYVIHPSSVPVPRQHRRAKTDRLDTGLLKRAFHGWLRGEPGHCTMAAIPTLAEEDARRPGRERETLVRERTRIGNRIKAALARLGIHNFMPTLRNASQRLETLRTLEGVAVPPNTLAELRHDMARLSLVKQQIKEIETARHEQMPQVPGEGGDAMVHLLNRVVGVGVESSSHGVFSCTRIAAGWPRGIGNERPTVAARRARP
jgi:transposase